MKACGCCTRGCVRRNTSAETHSLVVARKSPFSRLPLWQVISMKTFCKFVGEVDKEPKDVIMVAEENVTLAEYFHSLGIITPEAKSQPANGVDALEDIDGEGGEGDGEWDQSMGGSGASERSRQSSMLHSSFGRGYASVRGLGMRPRFAPSRKYGNPVVGKFAPNKFMGGVTKRSTHIKPYLEAYNRYTTAERRRLRGDPVS